MNVADRVFAVVFIISALIALITGELTFFEGFVCILLGNILLAIRERDA